MEKHVLYLCLALAYFQTIFNVQSQVWPQSQSNYFLVDPGNNGTGTLSVSPTGAGLYGIKFGAFGSGEAIISTRNTGTNISGLDFFTNNLQRLRLLNNGNIGIGPYATPTARLSFGPYNYYEDKPMRLALFDNGLRFGLGYYEDISPQKRIFAFYVGDPSKSRYGFFDDYSSEGVNGNEFVTFNATNRNVGINSTNPGAMLHVIANPTNSAYNSLLARFQTGNSSTNYSFVNIGLNTNNILELSAQSVTSGGAPAYAPLLLNGGTTAGNVGVGSFPSATNQISSPQSKLHVQYGAFQVSQSGAPVSPRTARTGLTMGSVGNTTVSTTSDYSWIQSSSGPLLLNPLSGNTVNGTQTNNYVAIGIERANIPYPAAVPNGYNLLVGGKIMCEELKIKLITGWYDHVFNKDYKLISLDSLENYISQNNHLPEIPSASEVEENGIMAGEMNGLLLKKVEELTLYMIEQNKNAAAQAEQIERLKKQNELLEKQNELIMQQVQILISKEQK